MKIYQNLESLGCPANLKLRDILMGNRSRLQQRFSQSIRLDIFEFSPLQFSLAKKRDEKVSPKMNIVVAATNFVTWKVSRPKVKVDFEV